MKINRIVDSSISRSIEHISDLYNKKLKSVEIGDNLTVSLVKNQQGNTVVSYRKNNHEYMTLDLNLFKEILAIKPQIPALPKLPEINKDTGEVVIYIDGGCERNGQRGNWGGWGVFMRIGDKEHYILGTGYDTTNNKMELTAAIRAVEVLPRKTTATIYCDSKYVVDGITKWVKTWRKDNWGNALKKNVKNLDLWMKLYGISKKRNITWKWVKGHSGVAGNEIADILATLGSYNGMSLDELDAAGVDVTAHDITRSEYVELLAYYDYNTKVGNKR